MANASSPTDDLEAELARVKQAIKTEPGNAQHRIAYFEKLCVLGDWERAGEQLKLVEDLQPSSSLFAQVFFRATCCELERREVYAGRTEPVVFGEPSEWVAQAIGAFRHARNGDCPAAARAQALAFEAAPAVGGTLKGQPIEWVADADSRFGPILEAFIDGHYRWIPFERISQLTIPVPTHGIDKVWAPARFVWTNQGTADGLIPVRYLGSETLGAGGLRRAALTEWKEQAPGFYTGLGQRTISTDSVEVGILELRDLSLAPDPTGRPESASGA